MDELDKNQIVAANRARDRRIRRLVLECIDQAKVNACSGWITGRMVFDLVNGAVGIDAPDNDAHMLALLRDLTIKGWIEERDTRETTSQNFGLDRLEYKIIGNGISLVNWSVPPDPDIFDPRRNRNEESGATL